MEQHVNETVSLLFQEINKNDVTGIMNYFGLSATISIAFLALLFTIAAIIYSFGGDRITDPYHLKYLIKVDLVSAAVLSIIPQLILIPFIYAIRGVTPKIAIILLMIALLAFQVCVLWKSANTCYYFILQNNSNMSLKNLLKIKTLSLPNQLIDYEMSRYDVYSIKKTLYPRIYKKILHSIHPQIYKRILHSILQNKKNVVPTNKVTRISKWDKGFDAEINRIVKMVSKHITEENPSIADVLVMKKDRKVKKELKIIKPKLQAPDRVTEICLDKLARTEKTYDNMDKIDLEYCLVLLYSCKAYSESRQDEKRRWDVFQKRSRYTNPDDTYMYTLYGNILYHLGKVITDSDVQSRHYEMAHEAYECAIVVNRKNEVAIHNKKYLEKTYHIQPL